MNKSFRVKVASSRDKASKPFGIKWPDEPIKALGVYYSYNIKLARKKIIERLDSVKKLINIWSSRGLSIYGKVIVIKSLSYQHLFTFPCFCWSPRKSLKS